MRLRWKKNPRETGLRAVGAAPQGSYYHDGDLKYASVSPLGGGWRAFRGWYFVAGWDSGVPHYNSCNSPCETEAEAKKMAQEYVKRHMRNPE